MAPAPSLFAGKKHCDPRDQQRLRQPLHDRVDQRAQVGLRVQAAAEVDQRLAVVEALLIEDAVDPRLNRPLQRIEDRPVTMIAATSGPRCRGREARVDDLRRSTPMTPK